MIHASLFLAGIFVMLKFTNDDWLTKDVHLAGGRLCQTCFDRLLPVVDQCKKEDDINYDKKKSEENGGG